MELFAIIGVLSTVYWGYLIVYLWITNNPPPPEYNREHVYPARYTPPKPRGQVTVPQDKVTTVTPQRDDVTPKKAPPGRIVDHTNLEE